MAEKETTSKKSSSRNSSKSTTKKSTKATTKKSTSKSSAKVTPIQEVEVVEEVKEEKVTGTKNGMSSEEKRVLGLFGILLIIIGLYVLASIVDSVKINKLVNKVASLKAAEESHLIYLMKKDCSYCELNKENNESLKRDYGVDYLEIDVSKLGTKKRDDLLTSLGLNPDDFGTPTYVVTKNNEVINVLSGIQAFNVMFNELQNDGIIASDKKLYLNYINYDGFKNILKSNKPEVVVFTSTTCHFCISERPILEKIAEENNVKINWMYLNGSFNSQEEYDEFKTSLKWFVDNSDWGTPTTLIIQNGEAISALSGYREYDDFVSFLKQNNIIVK